MCYLVRNALYLENDAYVWLTHMEYTLEKAVLL